MTEQYQISTTGFAGTTADPDHYEKNQIEKDFILKRVKQLFKDPPIGSWLRWKGYDHDFGMYYELTIYWPALNSDIEEKVWNWINKVESYDWESEEVTLRNLWEAKQMGVDLNEFNDVIVN